MKREDLAGESGAVLVLVTILLFVMIGLAALVVDLGFLYVDRHESKTITDMAATAGAMSLEPSLGGSPQDACETAWGYLRINSGVIPDDEPSPCGAFASMPVCGAATLPVTATKTVGPYEAAITIPVADDSPLMEARLVRDIDGDPCERVGVSLERTRSHTFGPVLGRDQGTTLATSVARSSNQTRGGDLVSLVILERTACDALVASGQAQVRVRAAIHPETGEEAPGIITVDSAGTSDCSNSAPYTIDALGEQNSRIRAEGTSGGAPGIIFSHALMPGNQPARSYDPSDVPLRLSPMPIAGRRLTRAAVDYRYNCKASYPDPLIPACPGAGAATAHIDALRSAIGTSGQPAGYQDYNAYVTSTLGVADPCKLPSSTPAITMPTGNWWVNCPSAASNEKGIEVGTSLTFPSGSVVFEGTVDVAGGLSVNASGAGSAVMYVRGGSLIKDAQAVLTLQHTFVYLADGVIDLGAGSATLTWRAPDDPTFAFDDLALWSESPAVHQLGGQATLDIEGAFFTPNAAPFQFTGQGDQQQTKAQFITRRLLLKGQGELIMQPDPERVVTFSLQGVGLIR